MQFPWTRLSPTGRPHGPILHSIPAHVGILGSNKQGAIQFAVTKLFGTDSHVPFFAAITSWYRKFIGSITERVISVSNSNSPNNTGWNRLNINISVTVMTRRSTWQDTPVIALPPWLPGGVPCPRNLSLLPPLFFKLQL
jgi:hypothetical protein